MLHLKKSTLAPAYNRLSSLRTTMTDPIVDPMDEDMVDSSSPPHLSSSSEPAVPKSNNYTDKLTATVATAPVSGSTV